MDSNEDSGITFYSKFKAQKRISTLWFILSFILILLFVIFTFTNRFEANTADAWQWLMQQLIPSLTLFIGVFVSASQEKLQEIKVRAFFYKLTFGLSIAYFFLLILTLLAIPYAVLALEKTVYEYLQLSSTYLIPVLGLVTASLGMFFSREEKSD
jgi:Ni/Fe-hydrogenase subunit HybB-like protein